MIAEDEGLFWQNLFRWNGHLWCVYHVDHDICIGHAGYIHACDLYRINRLKQLTEVKMIVLSKLRLNRVPANVIAQEFKLFNRPY